jgi:hypothetical protein
MDLARITTNHRQYLEPRFRLQLRNRHCEIIHDCICRTSVLRVVMKQQPENTLPPNNPRNGVIGVNLP